MRALYARCEQLRPGGYPVFGQLWVALRRTIPLASSAICSPDDAASSLHKCLGGGTDQPIIVSENGIGSADDNLRIRYIDESLQGLHDAIMSGVPVLGYLHWSLLDNFEWLQGFPPRYGLTSVDQKTFARTPKPSAYHLGSLAKRNSL